MISSCDTFCPLCLFLPLCLRPVEPTSARTFLISLQSEQPLRQKRTTTVPLKMRWWPLLRMKTMTSFSEVPRCFITSIKNQALRVVYLTGGDVGPAREYWQMRKQGVRAADDSALGENIEENKSTVHAGGRDWMRCTHPSRKARLKLVFLRLPDGNRRWRFYRPLGSKSSEVVEGRYRIFTVSRQGPKRDKRRDHRHVGGPPVRCGCGCGCE